MPERHADPVRHPLLEAAIRAGMDAARRGVPAGRNPHDGRELRTSWAYGWHIGRGWTMPRDLAASAGRLGLADVAADMLEDAA